MKSLFARVKAQANGPQGSPQTSGGQAARLTLGHWAAERGRGLAPPGRRGGGAGGGGRTPPWGWGRLAAARRCAARVGARSPASPPARSGPLGLKALTELPMRGRPRSWLFRVASAAAALLLPEQHARPLAARPPPRPRSQASGKCAASPQPPGSAARPQGPAPRGSADWEGVPAAA